MMARPASSVESNPSMLLSAAYFSDKVYIEDDLAADNENQNAY